MLLAAGLGTRMAPLTRDRPKTTLPVLDRPLVRELVEGLARQGIEAVIVNAHRNPEAIRKALADPPIPVQLSLELELRGSGGGILQARSFLAQGDEPFLVLNADMGIDLDLGPLLASHARQGGPVTLLLRDEPRKEQFGSIGYADDGRVRRITQIVDRGGEAGSGLFTGVHVMDPAVFERLPARAVFDIVRDVYVPWIERDGGVGSWLQPPTARWSPVGCPRELLDANLELLVERSRTDPAAHDGIIVANDAHIEGEVRGPAFIGAGARVPAGARIGPHVVVGARSRIPPDSSWRESLLLPDARPAPQGVLERAIGFGHEVWIDG